MKQITLNQKRKYIIPFTWEDYKLGHNDSWDVLIYKWSRLDKILSVELAYRVIQDELYWTNKISLSEIKIDRTPNLLTQLYHSIIDL